MNPSFNKSFSGIAVNANQWYTHGSNVSGGIYVLYDSIMFHNVEYMPECEGGRALCRLPQELLPCL